jgi:hypothetical protein
VAADLGGCALSQNSTRVHDRHPITIFRFLHEVSRHHRRYTLLAKRGDAPPKLAAGQRISAAGGLVEK